MSPRSIAGFASLLRPHRGRLAAGLGCLVVLAATGAGYAYLTGPLLRAVLTGGQDGAGYLPLPQGEQAGPALVLLTMAALLGGLALLKGLAHLGQALLLDGTAERIGHTLRVRVYEHLMHLPLSWHRRNGLGDLIARLLDDVQRVQEAAVAAPISLVREGLAALALLLVALIMSPRLTLAAAVLLPLAGLLIGLLARGVKRASGGRQRHLGALANRAAVALSAVREVKSCGAEQREIDALTREGRQALRWSRRRIALRAAGPLANEVMAAIALGATLIYAGTQIASGALAPERFVSFFAAILMLYRPVKAIGQAVHVMAAGQASVERIEGMLQQEREGGRAEPLRPLSRRFELRGVSFSYEVDGSAGSRRVLSRIDLSLEVGRIVALAGPSGAGKSTLASIACGLERPTGGSLLWDGEDVSRRPLADLRAQVALVPQQPLVLPASLEENLRYGAPGASELELRQALRAVGLDALVKRFDGGLVTELGPARGLGVSVGEGQRLALARALLRKVRVLVLDEPSSALDAQSEQKLVHLLQGLRDSHAVLVVAHSPALMELADSVVWLADGEAQQHDASAASPGRMTVGSHRRMMPAPWRAG